MSGVAVVRYLLAAHGPLLTVVPAARIMAGTLPLATTLPAISVTSISATTRHRTSMAAANALVTERVQVSILTSTYPVQKSTLALVRDALAHQRGTINGVTVVDVIDDVIGPDLYHDDTKVFQQSADYFVRWIEA